MTNAITGWGTLVEVYDGVALTALGEVVGVTPPNESVEQLDATHMQSPARTREFIQGMIDPGDMTITMNHIPGSDTDDYIVAWRTEGDTRTVRITYPNERYESFPAFITGYAPDLQTDAVAQATLTLKVAGAISRGEIS